MAALRVRSRLILKHRSIDQGSGSGQTLNGNGEGFALGAGVAIVADFAVEPGYGDR